jgi:hypothetical protein
VSSNSDEKIIACVELIARSRVKSNPDISDRCFVKTDPGIHANQEMALKTLARETHTSKEEVEQVYNMELATLKAGARIHTFIPALALRRARATLHNRRHQNTRR